MRNWRATVSLQRRATQRSTKYHAVADVGLKTTKGVPTPNRTVKVSLPQELIEHDCMARHSDRQGPSSPSSAASRSLALG